jgi:hypothetical protein
MKKGKSQSSKLIQNTSNLTISSNGPDTLIVLRHLLTILCIFACLPDKRVIGNFFC